MYLVSDPLFIDNSLKVEVKMGIFAITFIGFEMICGIITILYWWCKDKCFKA